MKNMKKTLLLNSLLILGIISSSAIADIKKVKESLNRIGIPDNEIQIEASDLPNWHKVIIEDAPYYVSDDGAYLMQGPIFNIQGKNPINIDNSANARLIKSIEKDAIVYKAPNSKYDVSIFTDYSCGYCKKLHEEIPSYLEKGISVHYYAFPRAGAGSKDAKLMQAAWNQKDKQKALNDLYSGDFEEKANDTTQVDLLFNIGLKLGISGTPSIFLENGQMVGGYLTADQLLEILQR